MVQFLLHLLHHPRHQQQQRQQQQRQQQQQPQQQDHLVHVVQIQVVLIQCGSQMELSVVFTDLTLAMDVEELAMENDGSVASIETIIVLNVTHVQDEDNFQ